jgi:hypothetical protein
VFDEGFFILPAKEIVFSENRRFNAKCEIILAKLAAICCEDPSDPNFGIVYISCNRLSEKLCGLVKRNSVRLALKTIENHGVIKIEKERGLLKISLLYYFEASKSGLL